MIVNRAELADVLGCALATVDKHVGKGMPYVERPDKDSGSKQWRFDTGVCIKWLVEQAKEGSEMTTARQFERREQAAKAGLKELELAERQGMMVLISDVGERVESEYAIVKSRFQAIPGRMSQRLAVETDPVLIQNLLKAEVSEALEEISKA